jgi:hypothetical protein
VDDLAHSAVARSEGDSGSEGSQWLKKEQRDEWRPSGRLFRGKGDELWYFPGEGADPWMSENDAALPRVLRVRRPRAV